ncbi:uncharacterized protein LOC120262701 [Dioscorea cayenensis subsp. rotundata]|uniref:Uncharacterized protein LOC120262701 n=1 Tax=Dioscorea cayennensis subsp. rotundata TaxID=55577 RepID=A0AB40BJ06_DIOCR|nr:uncharacterized protein LOC120262701 [Dioscorea cayenensis subsp. rotundata]
MGRMYACVVPIQYLYMMSMLKGEKRTSSLTGHRWVYEILNGSDTRFFEQVRMNKSVFRRLVDELTQMNVEERFQHSGEIVHRQFHRVLKATRKLGNDITRPIDGNFKDVHDYICGDVRYWPYFKDCIGTIDGTHVAVLVPTDSQGSAHDARVLMEALRNPSLQFPQPLEGKYYLVDSRYPTMKGFLGSYKSAKYHIPQYRMSHAFRSPNEVFNYHHSSLRSVIERTFGVCKAKWRILQNMTKYSLKVQFQIIWSCFALHNFIRRMGADDLDVLESIEDINQIQEGECGFEGDDYGSSFLLRRNVTDEGLQAVGSFCSSLGLLALYSFQSLNG